MLVTEMLVLKKICQFSKIFGNKVLQEVMPFCLFAAD